MAVRQCSMGIGHYPPDGPPTGAVTVPIPLRSALERRRMLPLSSRGARPAGDPTTKGEHDPDPCPLHRAPLHPRAGGDHISRPRRDFVGCAGHPQRARTQPDSDGMGVQRLHVRVRRVRDSERLARRRHRSPQGAHAHRPVVVGVHHAHRRGVELRLAAGGPLPVRRRRGRRVSQHLPELLELVPRLGTRQRAWRDLHGHTARRGARAAAHRLADGRDRMAGSVRRVRRHRCGVVRLLEPVVQGRSGDPSGSQRRGTGDHHARSARARGHCLPSAGASCCPAT